MKKKSISRTCYKSNGISNYNNPSNHNKYVNRKSGFMFILLMCLYQVPVYSQSWKQVGFDMDGEAANDYSGYSVSLSSDGITVAIGAYQNDGNGNNSGQVRVYGLSGSTWTQKGNDIDGEFDLIGAGDYSGYAVSLSSDGKTVAIGAPRNDGPGYPAFSNAGQVRIYNWDGTTWAQKGNDIDGEAAGDWSGNSVSLSANGNKVAIGAPYNTGDVSKSGHVRVYSWNGSAWTQNGDDINGESTDDIFGNSVCLSADGNTLAVGAPWNDVNGSKSGHTKIFSWNGSSWTQKGVTLNGKTTDDKSGSSVSLSDDGKTVAIGSPENDDKGSNSGIVRVYTWISNEWIQKGSDLNGESSVNYSGTSVDLNSDGNILAIGAPSNSGNGSTSGHVRVYRWSNNTWSQEGNDIDGETSQNRSGTSVSLSASGDTIAIGAHYNSETAAYAGHTRVFSYNSATGITSNFLNPVLSVYPNPTSGKVTIELGSIFYDVSLKVRNIVGQIVSTQFFGKINIISTELRGSNGLYLLEVTTENGKSTIMVFKE